MQNMIEMFFFREIFQQNRHFKKCEYFNIFGLKEEKYVYATTMIARSQSLPINWLFKIIAKSIVNECYIA